MPEQQHAKLRKLMQDFAGTLQVRPAGSHRYVSHGSEAQ
jgi:hypothetical protein